jgi:hypothetical protein
MIVQSRKHDSNLSVVVRGKAKTSHRLIVPMMDLLQHCNLTNTELGAEVARNGGN